jgi:FAD/FMN-containing dehydrogenase
VLPSGDIWHGLGRLRKDNTGYDLRNLLIGAEGTLGVITAATLRLAPVPAATGTAVFVVRSPAAALDLLGLARDRLAEGISAFELIAGQGLHFLSQTLPDLRQPFATPPEWCVLIDLGLSAGIDPAGALTDLFEAARARDLADDGVIAQTDAQHAALWSMREHIPEANRRIGAISSHDISLPLGHVARFIDEAGRAVAALGDFRINCFGHLGDGNLHYNVFPARGRRAADDAPRRGAIKRAVLDLVHDLGGSISAEHGIGRARTADLQRYGDPVRLAMMRAIKTALDPAGIMNPGVILPDPSA